MCCFILCLLSNSCFCNIDKLIGDPWPEKNNFMTISSIGLNERPAVFDTTDGIVAAIRNIYQ